MNPRKRELQKTRQQSPIVLYTTDDGKVTVQVVFANETFWLTQKTIAALFGVQVPAISKHLKNIFEINELIEDSVVSILETTASARAYKEYDKFRVKQDREYLSDFDQAFAKYLKGRSDEDKRNN